MTKHAKTVNDVVNDYGFKVWGEIILKKGQIEFDPPKGEDEQYGIVYLWVQCDQNYSKSSYVVRYVGRAGKTMSKRLEQHRRGLKNDVSVKGPYIKNIIKQKRNRILIFTRCSPNKSPFTGLLKNTKASYSYVEEEILITFFKDLYKKDEGNTLWNGQRNSKHKKPTN